jgi:helicase SWR1
MLKKANQKRRLDDLIMQEGDFTTDYFAKTDLRDMLGDDVLSGVEHRDRTAQSGTPLPNDASFENRRMQEALAEAEDDEDAEAARKAYADVELDAPDFGPEEGQMQQLKAEGDGPPVEADKNQAAQQSDDGEMFEVGIDSEEEEEEEGGALDEYLLNYVDYEWNDFFSHWKTKRT